MNKKFPSPLPEWRGKLDDCVEFQRYHLQRYAEIGMALSGEENLARLLEMIVYEAREITNADAGTLYMVNDERTHLNFVIMQNETMDVFLGGVEGGEITMPPVPLYVHDENDGSRRENHAHVSAHVALSAEIVNIHDVRESEEFDFSGTRAYDQQSGYRSRSMLVIPMRNHEKDIIGVLQLLNARHPENGEVVDFRDAYVSLVASLASQAAVTLTKTRLIQGLTELLDAFVRIIAQAIEEKSRYTGGHIARVSKLASMIAEEIDKAEQGPFRDVHFTPLELEELRLAAWLHDIGKIVTPEFIVDKSRKLETLFDRGHLVNLRFDLIAKSFESEQLRHVAALPREASPDEFLEAREKSEARLREELARLEEERCFVLQCNLPGDSLGDAELKRLRDIALKTYEYGGEQRPYLEDDELRQLMIRKGTLTPEERRVMEEHAGRTWRMLSPLPFPKHLRRVPEFAAQHHEKLDGSGYPFGLYGAQLSLQTRIMAVADIFEALTASDRPYKKAMKLSQAIEVLGQMKDAGYIDPRVHDLFLGSGLVGVYAGEVLSPDQVDISLEAVRGEGDGGRRQRGLEALLARTPLSPDRARPLLLVVDDSDSSRMLLSYYLKGAPFDLEFAETGAQGLACLAGQGHDLVLVDLELMPMDGYDLARRIRTWEGRHALPPRPVLAMAAPFMPHAAARLAAAGFTESLVRPFGKQELCRFLSTYTSR